jgi:hypothetical protein
MRLYRSLKAAALPLSIALALLFGASVGAASLVADVQANNPQVQGDPTSNTTAVFPTNKQNEPTIAVNPTNPAILISGSNDEQRQPPCGPGPVRGDVPASDCSFFPNVGTSGIYLSSNGGATWANNGLLDDQPSWKSSALVSDGDPVIVYGPKPNRSGGFSYANGARAYYATLASFKTGQSAYASPTFPEVIAVAFSDNNGLTWSAPVIATKDNPVTFNDKEAIGVDDNANSPYFGRVYVSWTSFRSATVTGYGNEPILTVYSTNGGFSFSSAKQLSPAGNNGTGNGRQGSAITTGPDGSVYIAWEQRNAQVVAISRDGGVGWSRPVTIGAVSDLADPIPGANFRTDSFASIGADPRTGNSTIYAAWSNRTAQGGRIVVSTSSDKGLTWSAPVTVSGSEGYAFFQGLDVAPNGRVDLGYQALKATNPSTFGTGNAVIDSYYVGKSAGGSWSAPLKISSASSDPAASAQNNLERQFYGDYNTLVSASTRAWFIYTDTRNGVGCPAVDAYQQYLFSQGLTEANDEDIAEARRQGPDLDPPSTKPAPPLVCDSQFGNSDAYVSVITP